ncbi:MAG: signal peptide peptidase SppA [Bacteroidaceae bacterium]|nr:signal peptide peptidase SppA [Bacteroidaceae bacterium]
MKDFLKYTLATIVGILVLSVVITVIGIGSLAGMVASSETETKIRENSVFHLKLQGTVHERCTDNPILEILSQNEQAEVGLEDILASLTKAAENDRIKGLFLEAKGLAASPATIITIRDAIKKFKDSGKFVYAYGDTYTQGDYIICSTADKVILNPQGALDWHGLASQSIFFKDAMEQFGVKMQIFKVGTYKSAVEPFTETKMSDANREQVTAYLSSIWNNMVKAVSEARGIDEATLNAYADEYLLFNTAEDVVAKGMADTLLYMDGTKALLQQAMGLGEKASVPLITLNEVKNIHRNKPLDKSGNIIAVYYAEGDIVQQPSQTNFTGEPEIASDKVIIDLRKLRDDESVKAVVFRVNSGGGSAYASEQIWNEIVRLKEKKPVIVSMGDLAASGGYYISCAADAIVAEPTTLTGSIGIFGMIPCAEELVQKKVKLHFDGVKTNTLSDMGSLYRIMNAEESAKMQKMIEYGYQTFITRCANGRGKTTEQIDAIGQGRVWTGEAALGLGLVDVLGDIKTAEKLAAEKAGISSYSLVSYPDMEPPFSTLLKKTKENYFTVRFNKTLGDFAEPFHYFENLGTLDMVQARLPYFFRVEM